MVLELYERTKSKCYEEPEFGNCKELELLKKKRLQKKVIGKFAKSDFEDRLNQG